MLQVPKKYFTEESLLSEQEEEDPEENSLARLALSLVELACRSARLSSSDDTV